MAVTTMQSILEDRSNVEHSAHPSAFSSRRSSMSDRGSIASVELFWRPASHSPSGSDQGKRLSRKSSATSMSVHDAESISTASSPIQTKAEIHSETSDTFTDMDMSMPLPKKEGTGSDKIDDQQILNGGVASFSALPLAIPISPKTIEDAPKADGGHDHDAEPAKLDIVDLSSTASLPLPPTLAVQGDRLPPISPAYSLDSTDTLPAPVPVPDAPAWYTHRSTSSFTTWGLANPSRRSLVSTPSPSHRSSPRPASIPYNDSYTGGSEGHETSTDILEEGAAARSRTFSVCSSRRNGRKQPPRLTESLELLASMSVSPRTAPGPLPDLDGGFEGERMSNDLPMRIIEVDLPPLEPGAALLLKMPKASSSDPSSTSPTERPTFVPTNFEPVEHLAQQDRRKSSQQTFYSRISRRQSSLPALDPASVRQAAAAGPRFSLFPNSAAHRKIVNLRFERRESHTSGPSSANSDVPGLSCSGTATESTCGTWDMDEEPLEVPQGIEGGKRKKETRKARKARQKAEKARFDATRPPDQRELFDASMLEVIDEHGKRVGFGELVRGRKTIVVFLRHWFCSMCAQYMKAIVRDVRPEALEEAGVQLIVIGNGSAKMIDGYAYKHFKSPFKTYTDPTLALYRALGLTRQTTDAGADEDRGDYLTETVMEQTVATVKRATKMPLRNPGHFTQLGGEFIFDGPMNVIYTHRMINTRDHAPIRDVCAEAGVQLEHIHYEPGLPPPEIHRPSAPLDMQVQVADMDEEPLALDVMEEESERNQGQKDDWKARRDATLARMQMLKAMRTGGVVDLKKSMRDLDVAAGSPVSVQQ